MSTPNMINPKAAHQLVEVFKSQIKPRTYIEQEMYAVAPLPVLQNLNGQFCMQIRSERGATNWLNITPRQFSDIEKVLLSSLD